MNNHSDLNISILNLKSIKAIDLHRFLIEWGIFLENNLGNALGENGSETT